MKMKSDFLKIKLKMFFVLIFEKVTIIYIWKKVAFLENSREESHNNQKTWNCRKNNEKKKLYINYKEKGTNLLTIIIDKIEKIAFG